MTYYTVYKITNQINGKIYIGSHKTEDLNDNYMGSGTLIKRAQQKYGIDNFFKEILFIFESSEEMYLKESELVNEDFISDQNTYNIKIGGYGGFDYINSTKKNLYGLNGKNGIRNLYNGWNRIHTQQEFDKISKTLKEGYSTGRLSPTFKGKCHSTETKNKIGHISSMRESGSGNSQFGTMWITDGVNNKKIKKDEQIPNGWKNGKVQNIESDPVKWITDGINNKRIKSTESIPEGWTHGMTNSFTWITDGIKSLMIKSGDPIPSGWETGRAKGNKSYAHITNGITIKYHDLSTPIPDGYYRGRVLASKKQQAVKLYTEYLEIYQKVGWQEFVKITGYKYSRPNLIQRFNTLLPEFKPHNGKRGG